MSSASETSVPVERYTGRVKWFNNKTGYGFVTVTDGSKSGTDVFVHHSSVQVEKEQYRYLVQGEYVQFELSRMSEGPHEFQASNVTGVNGGQLMCETLLENGNQVRPYVQRRPRRDSTPREPKETLPPARKTKPTTSASTTPSTNTKTTSTAEPRSASGRGSGRGAGRGGSGRGRGGAGRG